MENAAPTALDATLWDEPTTGIGLCTRELHAALVRGGANVVRLGARRSGEFPRRASSRTRYTLDELPRWLRGGEVRLFHALGNFNLPLVRTPGVAHVLTVHDLIPELLPDTVSRAFRWQFRLWLSRSLRVADRVICVSEKTRQDLLQRFDADPSRVHVVHNGVDHIARVPGVDGTGEQYLRTLGLPARFVLYAGSLDARKNVGRVLDAVERLYRAGRAPTLVLIGQSWFGGGVVEARIGTLRARGVDLRPLGYLTPALFYEVMRRASVFVFPSRYEGFGLPPLEAMSLGVPTIVSNAGSLPEVTGDAAIAVDAEDDAGLAEQIARVLDDESLRRRLADAGRAQARRFTWDAAAEKTLALYRDAVTTLG